MSSEGQKVKIHNRGIANAKMDLTLNATTAASTATTSTAAAWQWTESITPLAHSDPFPLSRITLRQEFMAFQFPDPSVTPEFTGANGITYSWDATDGKWVVKSFAAEDIIGDCATSEDTVCDQLEQLKLGLVEVEEEIESIAPALERGVWLYEQQS